MHKAKKKLLAVLVGLQLLATGLVTALFTEGPVKLFDSFSEPLIHSWGTEYTKVCIVSAIISTSFGVLYLMGYVAYLMYLLERRTLSATTQKILLAKSKNEPKEKIVPDLVFD